MWNFRPVVMKTSDKHWLFAGKKHFKSVPKNMEEKIDLPSGVFKSILMNKLNGRYSQSKEIYLKFYLASIEESYKLLEEAELLFENKSFERAYFLGFAALEEISKSQMAADVFTGFIEENIFKKAYRDHKEKISRVEWIKKDGNSLPDYSYDGVLIKDFDYKKKLKSLYVDGEFNLTEISTPKDSVSQNDAESVIKAVNVGLDRIRQVTEKAGEQIGTKGFMK